MSPFRTIVAQLANTRTRRRAGRPFSQTPTTRQKIAALLKDGELSQNEIAKHLGISRHAVDNEARRIRAQK
ncbi:hypothetical protein AchV4_0033 [Achromobacter phage vB_AchrS_AchV4]|uniref:PF0610-like winged HTH N-terminal domain-containing protein n=1 Tax=Achromobacter phage vB_AchrS_AchV4 TaxID=2796514 RepID=A0A7T3PH00_9CAUD|nr:hypothetical protein JT316_gp33 [Achromobacter phage vB_AchrS_AchV4]QPZ53310.1 hypothetical protein AchV4_0033 [Achromobacter phage vB_AchrS_AchV4]